MPSSNATARAPNTTEVMLASVSMAASELPLGGIVVVRLGSHIGLHEPEARQRKRHRDDHIDPLHGNAERQAGLGPVERTLHQQDTLPDHEQVEAKPKNVTDQEAP